MAEAVQYDKLTSVPYNKMNVTTCHRLLGVRNIALTPNIGGQLTPPGSAATEDFPTWSEWNYMPGSRRSTEPKKLDILYT